MSCYIQLQWVTLLFDRMTCRLDRLVEFKQLCCEFHFKGCRCFTFIWLYLILLIASGLAKFLKNYPLCLSYLHSNSILIRRKTNNSFIYSCDYDYYFYYIFFPRFEMLKSYLLHSHVLLSVRGVIAHWVGMGCWSVGPLHSLTVGYELDDSILSACAFGKLTVLKLCEL